MIFKLGVLLIFRALFSSGGDGFSLTGSCQKLKKTLELSSELNSLAKQRNLIGTMPMGISVLRKEEIMKIKSIKVSLNNRGKKDITTKMYWQETTLFLCGDMECVLF